MATSAARKPEPDTVDDERFAALLADETRRLRGYNQALKSKQRHIGFLMVLMQRLVTSSTAAIAATLGRRLQALEDTPAQLSLAPDINVAEMADMDGQSQLDELVDWPGWRSEKAEVATLLRLAEQALGGTDAKVEALLEHVYPTAATLDALTAATK